MGDFNTDINKHSQASKDLINLARRYGFDQLVQNPTHQKGGLLDLVFATRNMPDTITDIMPTYYSDHCIISSVIPLKSLQ